jgi:SPP1 gp7 family putative phage head morphogenesis protein
MAKAPILPAKPSDPTGADALERGAMRDFARRMQKIRAAYVDGLNRMPSEPAVNRRYTFNLDPLLLSTILASASSEVDAQLLEGGEQDLWFMRSYVAVAYQRGTGQAFSNLARQSPAYQAGQESLAAILRSDPYRRRIALVAAREYEEMVGLSGAVKADMARILTDGMARGLNPREIAKSLRQQAGVEARRANRIARTEITTALRRARLDESEDAQDRYGLKMLEMHYSALSPTTRLSHARRHGNLYTADQQRDWWSQDANSINCKCTSISVLVDDQNNPLVPSIVDRARLTEQRMKAQGKGPWAGEK